MTASSSPSDPDSDPSLWYRDGLRFGCTQCGKCCTIEGYVWVDQRQRERIATHLEIPLEEFNRKYVRRVGKRYSLVERPGSGHDCIFWKNGCEIYSVRPTQCRTFPFWPEQLDSREDWDEAAAECPGMNRGRLYSAEEIDRLAKGSGATDFGETVTQEGTRSTDKKPESPRGADRAGGES